MNKIVKINNQEVEILEIQGKRVLTTQQLAEGYGTTARRITENFNRNENRFIEGKHYYYLENQDLKEFKNQYAESDLVGKRASSLYLWTERGALHHAKILDTDEAWNVYEMLEESYFRYKEIVPKNEFDIMRNMIDTLEQVKYGVTQATSLATEANNKAIEANSAVKKLEDSLDIKINKDDVLASDIAHQLQLYSESGLAHSNLIGAIARVLKLKVDYKKYYEDDYIKITKTVRKAHSFRCGMDSTI